MGKKTERKALKRGGGEGGKKSSSSVRENLDQFAPQLDGLWTPFRGWRGKTKSRYSNKRGQETPGTKAVKSRVVSSRKMTFIRLGRRMHKRRKHRK